MDLSKEDITLLVSALSKYVECSKLECSFETTKFIYAYIDAKRYENYIEFLTHVQDLQNRLLYILKTSY